MDALAATRDGPDWPTTVGHDGNNHSFTLNISPNTNLYV